MMIKLNYRICIFDNMGVIVTKPRPLYDVIPRAALLEFLDITTALQPKFNTAICYYKDFQWYFIIERNAA